MHIFLENQTNNIYTNYIFRFAGPAQHGSSWSAILSNYPAQLVVFKLVSSQNSYMYFRVGQLPKSVTKSSWSALGLVSSPKINCPTRICELVSSQNCAAQLELVSPRFGQLAKLFCPTRICQLVSSQNGVAQLVFWSWSVSIQNCAAQLVFWSWSAPIIALPNSCFRVGQPSI